MKTLLKILGGLVALAAVGIGGFLAYVSSAWPIQAEVIPITTTVEVTPERVARGKQLASISPGEGLTVMHGAFSPDRRCLALERRDGTVTLFELATGQPRLTYGNKLPPRPSPRSSRLSELLGVDPLGNPVGSYDSRVSFAVAPDNRLLAIAGLNGPVLPIKIIRNLVSTVRAVYGNRREKANERRC